MQNEVKFSRYAETGTYVSDIGLEDFVKLYVNHRPAFEISKHDLYKAFQMLGVSDENSKPVMTPDELLELLQARGRLQMYNKIFCLLCKLLDNSNRFLKRCFWCFFIAWF